MVSGLKDGPTLHDSAWGRAIFRGSEPACRGSVVGSLGGGPMAGYRSEH
jgi:hypothetical protein